MEFGLIFAGVVVAYLAYKAGESKADVRIAAERLQFNNDCVEKQHKLAELAKSVDAKDRRADEKLKRLQTSRHEFAKSYAAGRKWLAEMTAEAERSSDAGLENYLRYKTRPAPAAAENVKKIASEKREWMLRAKQLEYEIKQLEEYFPILAEYRSAIHEELIAQHEIENESGIDPGSKFVSGEEWKALDEVEREETALERYRKTARSSADAGRRYERYLGYLYESDNWRVEYTGAIKGFDDFGRDLICRRGDDVVVVQAKRWRRDARILHMKHVVQLYGSTALLKRELDLQKIPRALLVSTTDFSEDAVFAANALGVSLVTKEFNPAYPCIKVHVSRVGEALYHLPFDQQYDRISMNLSKGDRYVATVREARAINARRAMRFTGLVEGTR
jgi:hypothetical protein